MLYSLSDEDSGDVTATKLEDGARLVPYSNVSNTFLLASPSDFESSSSAVYEISGISSDGIVIQADHETEEITAQVWVCAGPFSFFYVNFYEDQLACAAGLVCAC